MKNASNSGYYFYGSADRTFGSPGHLYLSGNDRAEGIPVAHVLAARKGHIPGNGNPGRRRDEPEKVHIFSADIQRGRGWPSSLLILSLQNILPLNPEHLAGVSWDLSFNTAASFVSNTNWQAYSGESALSYLSQSAGLTVQNFISAAVGISVLFVLIRGFVTKNKAGIGNFWKDLTRVTL